MNPSTPQVKMKNRKCYFLTIFPLEGDPGPLLDTRQERPVESEDSSPELRTVLAVKYTLWLGIIPCADGLKTVLVPWTEEASRRSVPAASPGSVVQNTV
jgi:hypothetical protein